MNIIKARQEERRIKINELVSIIKKAKEENKEIIEKLLILSACNKWSMSERIVKEYLKIAKFECSHG